MDSKIQKMSDEIEIVDDTSSEEDEGEVEIVDKEGDGEVEIVDDTSSEEGDGEVEIVDDTSSEEGEIVDKEGEEETEEGEYGDEFYIDSSSSLSSSFSESLKGDPESLAKNDRLNMFQIAVDEKIPVKFIKKIGNNFVNIMNLMNSEKNIIENFNILSGEKIKINENDLMFLFYFLNKDKGKEYIVNNFNLLSEKLNLKKFYVENFNSYARSFEGQNDFLLDKTNRDLEKYKDFYSKIENFKNSDPYNEVIDTVSVSNTEAEYFIKDGEYFFDKDNIEIVFDSLVANTFFTYIRMNKTEDNEFYKIHIESNKKIENFSIENNKIEFENYKIYLFYQFQKRGRSDLYTNYIILDFEKSKCIIKYIENTKEILKKQLKELLPNIIFETEEEKNIVGDFKMTIKNYDETKFYYLTHFSEIFSEFFYIREVDSLRSIKETLKIYFVGTEESREYLNYSIYFNIKKLYNEKYIIKFTSKTSSVRNIKEFISIMIKLFWYYDNINSSEIHKLQFIENPYTGVNGEGLGGKYEDRVDNSQREKLKKIESLMMKEPDLFKKSLYVRTCPCPKQPIIIPEKDVKDWQNYEYNGKKRNVVLFPPEKSQQKATKNYYVCPDDESSYFSLRENPDSNSSYPVIPCCTISNQQDELYKDYEKIIENPVAYWSEREKYRGKNINILKSLKILTSERLGNLPDFVSNLLNKVEKNNYLREGVYKTNRSSFVHCVLKASYDNLELISKFYKIQESNRRTFIPLASKIISKYHRVKTLNEKDKAVQTLRNIIVKLNQKTQLAENRITSSLYYFNTGILNQELYGYRKEEINDLIQDPKKIMDSKKIYRWFENTFLLNIFVFVYEKENDKTYLEIPRHKNYHLRHVKENLPSIFLFRHKSKYSYDVYELIRKKEGNKKYLFSPVFSKFMKKYLHTYNIYYIYTDGILKKNFYNNFDWSVILGKYLIFEQIQNSNGRILALNFRNDDEKPIPKNPVTVFVFSAAPFSCETSENIYETTKKICIEIFGDNYTIGSKGLWYPMNDKKKGFFVPCSDVKESDKFVCNEYEIIKNINNKNRELENFNICFWNTNIFLQVIRWIYLLEKKEPFSWFDKYVIEDKNLSKDLLVSYKFNVPYRFPNNITDSESGIKYFSSYIPELFDKKIYMYPELYSSTIQYLVNFNKSNYGSDIINNKVIKNIMKDSNDYSSNALFNRVFTKKEFELWYSHEIQREEKLTDIKEEYINLEVPYRWKNIRNKKIYIIQNNVENSIKVSIFNCKMKKLFPERGSYYYNNDYIIWEYVRDTYNKYNFGWTFEKLNEYIKNISGKNMNMRNEMECLDYLIKNNVVFEFAEEYSYLIYSHSGNFNNPINITDKYIYDDKEPLEVYMYTDGGYCSMFPIV